jgi:SAM-dependent methyltransferase
VRRNANHVIWKEEMLTPTADRSEGFPLKCRNILMAGQGRVGFKKLYRNTECFMLLIVFVLPCLASGLSESPEINDSQDTHPFASPSSTAQTDSTPGTGPDSDSETPSYASALYWDHRYLQAKGPFEWYQDWPRLNTILGSIFSGTERVLNIGCGNAPMSSSMREVFPIVVNIDISTVVIRQMREIFHNVPNLYWLVMDCTNMGFDDDHFDVAFDKGTIDALMCDSGWNLTVGATMREVHRVLKPGGLFFEITYGWPASRIWIFDSFKIDWVLHPPIRIRNVNQGGWHWIYIFQKIPKGSESAIVIPENETWGDGPQPPEVPATGPRVPGPPTDDL